MPTLTKENAQFHCHTCLKNLSITNGENNINEFKDLIIDVGTNEDLQLLLSKFIDENLSNKIVKNFPQNVCIRCFNKLQAFEKFRKRAQYSVAKLQALLNNGHSTTIEIEYDDDVDKEPNNSINSDDIYKLLLKDNLMETESVLLESTAIATPKNFEILDPDPFDTTTALVKNENNHSEISDLEFQTTSEVENGSSESSVSSDEEEAFKIENKNSYTPEKNNRITTRLQIRMQSSNDHNNEDNKKKRRSRKEIKELRQKLSEKRVGKIKRRNKGTKNTFKCTQCNHSFAHKITLDAHVRKVHEGSKRPFQCDRCDKSYTFIGGLYTHIKEIHETEVRSYSCDFPDCDRTYTSFIAMQKHKRVKHTETGHQRKYVCEQCGATFNQTGNLKYHRRTKHPTEAEQAEKEMSKERYECTICQKFFHSRYTLKYHTLQLHTNDMKYECNICGRRMAKKFMLVQHMLVHSTEKMPCEHCGKQFIRKFELEAHIRAVHMKLKPFECQYCTECFASRKTLRHHEYIHTGEKPYVCDICGQAYRQQTCLKNHRKSHAKVDSGTQLAANINRTLMSTFLGPQTTITQTTNAETTPLN